MPTAARPLKIVMVGMGTSPHVYRLAAAVAGRGYPVTVLMEDRFGAPPTVAGVTFRTYRAAAPFPAKALEVRNLIREEKPDVVHSHVVNLGGYVTVASGFHPHILTIWGSDLWKMPHRGAIHRLRTKVALRAADWVLSPSAALRDEAERMAGRLRRNQVQLWGVDTAQFHPGDAVQARRRLGWPQGRIVYSARVLQPLYNQAVLIEAWPEILRAVPDARLLVSRLAADAAYENQLRSRAAALGIESSVEWRDPVGETDLPDVYRALDVLVSIAGSDGTPSTLLEAMATGAQIVASDLPSIREWIKDGETGLLVAPQDAKAVGAAVVRYLEMPADARARMALAAQATIHARARREAALDGMLTIYHEAAARGARFSQLATLRNVIPLEK